jgi:hypothetical protein
LLAYALQKTKRFALAVPLGDYLESSGVVGLGRPIPRAERLAEMIFYSGLAQSCRVRLAIGALLEHVMLDLRIHDVIYTPKRNSDCRRSIDVLDSRHHAQINKVQSNRTKKTARQGQCREDEA